tara:strand:- start:168 stop:359 length:192 start_codon:yes stop_codon:yes gene_type:complete
LSISAAYWLLNLFLKEKKVSEEELEMELEDVDFSELDSFVGDDAWSLSFESTGSIELDVDFFL